MKVNTVSSPNISIRPVSTQINELGHLEIGGCDTVELANRFGTPLWIIDEETVRQSVLALTEGLRKYPSTRILFAGKAFTCLAMYRLVHRLGIGVDVVSEGELYTAIKADFPPELTYLHGNNKSSIEITTALERGVNMVVDSLMELRTIVKLAKASKRKANILLRVLPGVEPDTHKHIKTGQIGSKFGFSLESLPEVAKFIVDNSDVLKFLGLHGHIGSFCQDVSPYLTMIEILAKLAKQFSSEFKLEVSQFNVGGGLGCALVETDRPIPMYDWSSAIAEKVAAEFRNNGLKQPLLLVEPGRSIISTAGVTLYRAGTVKPGADNNSFLAVDGGMGDNPRPITYQAKYTACVANRMNEPPSKAPVTLVGKYCESGDVMIEDTNLCAQQGDVVAVFGTGAYNYSMSSNYNRTGRPACVLIANGEADIIIERETNDDLLRNDRVPSRLLK